MFNIDIVLTPTMTSSNSIDPIVDEDNGTVTVCLEKNSVTESDITVTFTARPLSPVEANS